TEGMRIGCTRIRIPRQAIDQLYSSAKGHIGWRLALFVEHPPIASLVYCIARIQSDRQGRDNNTICRIVATTDPFSIWRYPGCHAEVLLCGLPIGFCREVLSNPVQILSCFMASQACHGLEL